ncbi:MAG: Spy/CpxP family protein refolding chaperone [Planctomycetaceae bacterium]|jgi:Spy/CpxP family protein refolding chaperone|nr:Spy/CpxP family protein refolding chaperone [Planctomycetaceae bacterium]
MKRTIFSALTFIAVLTVALTAFAQPGGGPGGPGGRGQGGGPGGRGPGGFGGFDTVGGLLRNEEFKKELNLTEEQISQLTKLAEEQRPQRGERREGQGPPSREEMQKFREEIEKRVDEAQAKVNQVLSPEQQVKVKELRFKLAGGLDSPRLNARNLDVVNLTDEQKAKLKAIQEEQEKEGREALEKRGNVDWRNLSQDERQKLGQELRTEVEALQKKYAEKIKAVLTPDQLKKAEDLTKGVQEAREKFAPPQREGGRGERGDGYRPGADSWRPGQGGGQRREGGGERRRAFPQQEGQ